MSFIETLKDLKLKIQSNLNSIEQKWLKERLSPSIIIITFSGIGQIEVITDLQKKIHPKDTFLLACHHDYFRDLENFVGSSSIALISEDIPPEFLEFVGRSRVHSLTATEKTFYTIQHRAMEASVKFHSFQRDNGFLQVKNTAISLEGNRWNTFNSLPFDKNIFIDGGNFVHNDENMLITMSTDYEVNDAQREFLRRKPLIPFFKLKAMLTLPNLQDQLGLPHADLCAVWLNANTICIGKFNNTRLDALNKSILKLVQAFARDCSEKLHRVINVVNIPCVTIGYDSNSRDGRGVYAQAVVTENAIYIPQYGKKVKAPKGYEDFDLNCSEEEARILKDADEEARKAFEHAERQFGNGRPIIQIDSALISYGNIGGLHCLTTQLKGDHARRLLKDLREKGAQLQECDEDISL